MMCSTTCNVHAWCVHPVLTAHTCLQLWSDVEWECELKLPFAHRPVHQDNRRNVPGELLIAICTASCRLA